MGEPEPLEVEEPSLLQQAREATTLNRVCPQLCNALLPYNTCCPLCSPSSCSEMPFLRVQTQRLYGFAFCLGLALLFGTMVSSLIFCLYSTRLACYAPKNEKLVLDG